MGTWKRESETATLVDETFLSLLDGQCRWLLGIDCWKYDRHTETNGYWVPPWGIPGVEIVE